MKKENFCKEKKPPEISSSEKPRFLCKGEVSLACHRTLKFWKRMRLRANLEKETLVFYMAGIEITEIAAT